MFRRLLRHQDFQLAGKLVAITATETAGGSAIWHNGLVPADISFLMHGDWNKGKKKQYAGAAGSSTGQSRQGNNRNGTDHDVFFPYIRQSFRFGERARKEIFEVK